MSTALDVLNCPHKDECTGCGSLWGTTENDRVHKPSPHIGGSKLDELCVMFIGQNPGNGIDHEKFDADGMDFLQRHHQGLKHDFTPAKLVSAVGLDWEHVVWENLVKCPTVDNTINDTMIENCKPWLTEQIVELDPDAIVGLGAGIRDEFGVSFWSRSSVLHSPYLCTPHYGYTMRRGEFDSHCEKIGVWLAEVLPGVFVPR